MNKLTWSDDLAQLVKTQLENCDLKEAMPAASDDWIQLMAIKWIPRDRTPYESGGAEAWAPIIEGFVENWLSGAERFDQSMVESFPEDLKVKVEYGQLIWAKTQEVGCAFIVHRFEYRRGENHASLACNFRTGPGFEAGAEVYSKGTPGSACPSRNDEDGLCLPE